MVISFKNATPLCDFPRDQIEAGNHRQLGNPSGAEMYMPPAWKLIPPQGRWVGITRQLPPIEGNEIARIPGRAFYARVAPGADDRGFQSDGTYKVILRGLPDGDVYLWPYEYVPLSVESLIDGWQSKELRFHPLRLDSARLNAITFYARSRGIALEAAAVMALGSVYEPVGWFEQVGGH